MVALLPAIDLAAILAAAILAALVTVALIVLTPILTWIGNQIPLVGGWASSQLLGGITYIRNELLKAVTALIHSLTVVVGAFGQIVEAWVHAELAAVGWCVTGIEHLATAGVHAIVAAMIAGLIHGLHLVEHEVGVVSRLAHATDARLGAYEHAINDQLVGVIHPELVWIEQTAIPDLRAGEAAIRSEIGQAISPELARLFAQVGGLSAAVAAVEITVGELGSLRCGNVGTLARFLCGLDPTILQLLLGLAGDAFVLELLSKAHVSPGDVFGWAGTAASDLEKIVATF